MEIEAVIINVGAYKTSFVLQVSLECTAHSTHVWQSTGNEGFRGPAPGSSPSVSGAEAVGLVPVLYRPSSPVYCLPQGRAEHTAREAQTLQYTRVAFKNYFNE